MHALVLTCRAFVCFLSVLMRRSLRGPQLPGWSLKLEFLTRFMRAQTRLGSRGQPSDARRTMGPAPLPRQLRDSLTLEGLQLGGRPAECITPSGWQEGDPVLLFFHGGGYVVCSPATHRDMVGRFAYGVGARCYAIDYRLAPEHPFPEGIQDCVAAYRELIEAGISPSSLALAGDSAGGGLTVATLLEARALGLPRPACAALISPWLDHGFTAESIDRNTPTDYLDREALEVFSRHYLGNSRSSDSAARRNPLVSPVNADLSGLPPMFVHVGSAEVLLDDSLTFTRRAQRQGVEVDLRVAEGMVHDWLMFAGMLPEARPAVHTLTAFLRSHLVSGADAPVQGPDVVRAADTGPRSPTRPAAQ